MRIHKRNNEERHDEQRNRKLAKQSKVEYYSVKSKEKCPLIDDYYLKRENNKIDSSSIFLVFVFSFFILTCFLVPFSLLHFQSTSSISL